MFCSQCGAQNLDTAVFCERCGKQFDRRLGQQTHFSSPPLSARTSFIGKIKQQKNRGYAIAGVSAVVALFAFYFLPFMTYLSEFDPNILILYNPVAITAAEFDKYTQFSGLLTFITLILATLLIVRDKPFGMAKTPIVIQRRRAVYAMIGVSGLSILIYVFEVISNIYRGPFDSINVGFWLYLLAMGAIIAGSIMALRTLSSSLPPQAQREGQPPPTQSPPQSSTHR